MIDMTVASVDATTVTVTESTGVGDTFPATSGTAVLVGVQVQQADVLVSRHLYAVVFRRGEQR